MRYRLPELASADQEGRGLELVEEQAEEMEPESGREMELELKQSLPS